MSIIAAPRSATTVRRDPAGYEPRRALYAVLSMLGDDETARCLLEDLDLLQDAELDGLDPGERRALRQRYGALDSAFAAEVVAWFDGAYTPTRRTSRSSGRHDCGSATGGQLLRSCGTVPVQ